MFKAKRHSRRARIKGLQRPIAEALEGRILLSTIIVNTTGDSTGGTSISLRKAISEANVSSTAVTIDFNATVFSSQQSIKLTSDLPVLANVTQPITIIAPSAGVIINCNGQTSGIVVDNGVTTALTGISIIDSAGSGISNSGTLTLDDVTLSNNGVSGLNNSGTAMLVNCTLADNSTTYYGGGILNTGSAAILALTNVTMVGNSSVDFGGGLFSFFGGSTTIANSIIAGNICTGDAIGPDVYGTIASQGYNLIGKNDVSSGWTSQDLTGDESNPLNPLLNSLGNNGGPTQTALPMNGSPAIDHGSNALIPPGITTDQRGMPRIFNGTVDIGAVETQQSVGSVAGVVFVDNNDDGMQESGDLGLADCTVYADLINTDVFAANDPSAVTNANGQYSIGQLTPGSYTIRIVSPSGYTASNNPSTSVLVVASTSASGPSWGEFQNMVNNGNFAVMAAAEPSGGIGTMSLLPDGDVIAANGEQGWTLLTPDAQGRYVDGTWTSLPAASYSRLYDSTQVLPDGRLFVAGGEDGTGGSTGETYTPLDDTSYSSVTNVWTELPSQSYGEFADSISMMLPDDDVLIAPVYPTTPGTTVIFDPATNSWSQGPALYRGDDADEESWVKLGDGSILTIDSDSTSERYIPGLNEWVNDGAVPDPLFGSPEEMGPGFLLADGQAFFVGGDGHTAIYTPSGTIAPGTWKAGPDLPNGDVDIDGSGAMLPDGTILIIAGPVSGNGNMYLYSPTTNTFSFVENPPFVPDPYFDSRFLDLPDGTVLVNTGQDMWVYSPTITSLTVAKPAITSIAAQPDGSFVLNGIGLNGISAGAAYGDDAQMDSNYPIISLTSGNGQVYYARTYDWSSTGVDTGSSPGSTHFALPLGVVLSGNYSVTLIANGVASSPVQLAIAPTDIWLGDVSTVWNTSGNWSEGVTPGSATNVIINGGAVTESGAFSIASLVLNAGSLQLGLGSGIYTVSSLTLGSGTSLNLSDNELVVNYGSNPDPKAQINSYLQNGYDGATFAGLGIVSSKVASVNAAKGNSHLYAIGMADAADPAVKSQNYTPDTLMIKPVLVGDANMDGTVNFTDFQTLSANFNGAGTYWDQGNFNFGPKTNFTDFQLLAANFNDSKSLDNADYITLNGLVAKSDALGARKRSIAAVGNVAAANSITRGPTFSDRSIDQALLDDEEN